MMNSENFFENDYCIDPQFIDHVMQDLDPHEHTLEEHKVLYAIKFEEKNSKGDLSMVPRLI